MSDKDTKPVLKLIDSANKPPTKKAGNVGGGSGQGGGKSKNEGRQFGNYQIIDNCFYHLKSKNDGGFEKIKLCDFSCKVIEERLTDDGLSEESILIIEGVRENGQLLRRVEVSTKSFSSRQTTWITDAWGMKALVLAGSQKMDNIRVCIQMYSRLDGDIPVTTVYKHGGWKEIDEHWLYLTGTGAISATGLTDGFTVDLGRGQMSNYQLPAPLAGDGLKQAVNNALMLLKVCPTKPHIGAALLAAAVRAPLGECHPTAFAIWLHGLTGSRKSALAAIVQAFFGNFDANRGFPGNWSDSVNDCEMKAHQAKDGVFTVDDFKPSVSQAEAAKLHAMAERLIRNTGNQAGRGRRDSNMQAKAAPFNRSMMLITAEDLPRGQSLLGRLLILELNRMDVDNAVLSELQRAVALQQFTGLMSAYLQWLAVRLNDLKHSFPEMIQQLRNLAIREGFAASHPRAPEIYANLMAGIDTFLEFLTDVEAVTSVQSNDLLLAIETSLKQAFTEQTEYQTEQDETERFLKLLQAALSSGEAHIADRLNQGPPNERPFSWGWRDAGTDVTGDKILSPKGDLIGWYSEISSAGPAEVWLQPECVFKVVQQFARGQGETFLISQPSLWRRMQEKGLILKTEPDTKSKKPRTAVKRTVAGRSVRVMVLSAELIESG